MKLKIFLVIVGIIVFLSAFAAFATSKPFTPLAEKHSSMEEELDLPYYGELKVIQKADLQSRSGAEKSNGISKREILIVQDEVTGCMYFSNDKRYESLTPVYDETGKVKGCGEPVEQ